MPEESVGRMGNSMEAKAVLKGAEKTGLKEEVRKFKK